MRTDISERLRAARDRAADEALAGYDFGSMFVDQTSTGWDQDEPDRWICVVYGSAHGVGPTQKAQFNVWFKPGTAEVEDTYEGDWYEPR